MSVHLESPKVDKTPGHDVTVQRLGGRAMIAFERLTGLILIALSIEIILQGIKILISQL